MMSGLEVNTGLGLDSHLFVNILFLNQMNMLELSSPLVELLSRHNKHLQETAYPIC